MREIVFSQLFKGEPTKNSAYVIDQEKGLL